MVHRSLNLVLLPSLLLLAAPRAPHGEEPGALVLVGGGGTTEAILGATLELLGDDPTVVVVPQASRRQGRGVGSVDMWRQAGVERVLLLDPLDAEDAEEHLRSADLVWFPGGSQSALVEAVEGAGLSEFLRGLHASGTVIGGTSAGAAMMSRRMISGAPRPEALVSGAMAPLTGLGFWPEAIVDQHFVERQREARLLTAVLDAPDLLGVGISESTAVVVEGSELRVVGEGQVLVYDARDAKVTRVERGERQAGRSLGLQVLRDGDRMGWRE